MRDFAHGLSLPVAVCLAQSLCAQQAFTWQQVRDKFEAANPTLAAARVGIDESRAQEITAHLRPNPGFTATLDQIDPFTTNPYRPFANTFPLVSGSYLHERRQKRELRTERRNAANWFMAFSSFVTGTAIRAATTPSTVFSSTISSVVFHCL